MAAGAEPRRADRGRRERACRSIDAADRDDVLHVTVDLDRVEDVLRVRASVRNVMRIKRRRRADRDDENEDEEGEEREVITAQPPPGEVPRASAANRPRLYSSKLCSGIERELAFSPLDHSRASRGCGGGAGQSGAPTRYEVRLLVTDRREVELVVHVERVTAEIDVAVEGVDALLVQVRRPRRLLHHHLVDLRPL